MKKVHAENAENIGLTLGELSPAKGGMKLNHYLSFTGIVLKMGKT